MKQTHKIILSFFIVLVSAFIGVKQFSNYLGGQDRFIANSQERNSPPYIANEQNLALKIAGSADGVQMQTQATWHDKFLQEYLHGRYVWKSNKEGIQYILQAGFEGIAINSIEFLNSHGHHLKNYSSYIVNKSQGDKQTSDQASSLTNSQASSEEFILLDNASQAVGAFTFVRDEKNKILEIQIK